MIRPARPDDLPAIRLCAEAAFAPYVPLIGRRPAPMDADHAGAVAAGRVLVACGPDGAPCGFVAFWPEGGHMQLDTVALRPEAAGQGLGRALIAAVEDATRAAGLTEVRLYTNAAMAANLTLYPHLGFVQTARRVEDGFDRVFFAKRLIQAPVP